MLLLIDCTPLHQYCTLKSACPPEIGCRFLSSRHVWLTADKSSGFSWSPSALEKARWCDQLASPARMRLSPLRSLCRLTPAWIPFSLCQDGRIKGTICWSGFEMNPEICFFFFLHFLFQWQESCRRTSHCSVKNERGSLIFALVLLLWHSWLAAGAPGENYQSFSFQRYALWAGYWALQCGSLIPLPLWLFSDRLSYYTMLQQIGCFYCDEHWAYSLVYL